MKRTRRSSAGFKPTHVNVQVPRDIVKMILRHLNARDCWIVARSLNKFFYDWIAHEIDRYAIRIYGTRGSRFTKERGVDLLYWREAPKPRFLRFEKDIGLTARRFGNNQIYITIRHFHGNHCDYLFSSESERQTRWNKAHGQLYIVRNTTFLTVRWKERDGSVVWNWSPTKKAKFHSIEYNVY